MGAGVIYILYGADSFSRTERLRQLQAELDKDGNLATNTVAFDATQAAPQEVLAACDTVPFFGDTRLVLLEGALRTAGSGGGRRRSRAKATEEGESKGLWWALVEYAPRMPEQTVLVLLAGGSVDVELFDVLRPLATVEQFPLPAPREIAGWVQDRARRRGIQMDSRASAAMAELIGSDTWMLATEIEKLAMYAAGERITEKDVNALVPDVRDREAYYLADALADRKAAQATKLLHEMLAKGKHPGALLLTIENRYRRLAVAVEMINEGETTAGIGARLRMTGFGLERLLDQASRSSMPGIRWALDRIARADYDVKQGIHDDEALALELLVQDLAVPPTVSGSGQRVSAASAGSS